MREKRIRKGTKLLESFIDKQMHCHSGKLAEC